MAKTLRFLIPLVLFAALAGLLYYGLDQDPRKIPSPLKDKPAPAFDLPTLKDPNVRISNADLVGKVTLVNVWASWCASCRAEHAELMRIAGEEPDVQVIGFNWKDARADALGMLQRFGDPYRITAYDPDNEVGIDWGVYGAPETFVVDPAGIIREKHIGPVDRSVWEETLRPLIDRIKTEG